MNPSMGGYGNMQNRTGGFPSQNIGGRRVEQFQRYTPEQMQLFQHAFSQVNPGSYLSRLAEGDPSIFQEIEAPALGQFAGLQGQIASRFSGMGNLGSRRSSGFQNYMNQAASEFAQQLQAQRHGLQRDAIKDLQTLISDLLEKRPYEQQLVEPKRKKSFFEKLLGGVAPVAGAGLGFLAGGPFGAAIGGGAGSAFSEALR